MTKLIKWRRVGTEELHDDVLVTRVQRKPPVYRLERWDLGKKLVALMYKGPKGRAGKGYDIHILPTGSPEDGAMVVSYSSRRKAIRAFMQLQPVEHFDGIDKLVGESLLDKQPDQRPIEEQLREAANKMLEDGQ